MSSHTQKIRKILLGERKKQLIVLTIVLLAFPLSGQLLDAGNKPGKKEIQELLDSLFPVLQEHYLEPGQVPFIAKGLKSSFVTGKFRQAANKIDLAVLLSAELARFSKKWPMKISYYPIAAKALQTARNDSLVESERRARLARSEENLFGLWSAEVLPGNIGYIRWDRFDEFAEASRPLFDSVFHMLAACRAVVVDLRYNYGGYPESVRLLTGYFSDSSMQLADIVTASGRTIERYTYPPSAGSAVHNDLWILTSSVTSGAAEDLIFTLKKNRKVRIAGDTTAGIAHNSQLFTLGQGFVVSVPTEQKVHGKEKSTWQDSGIVPDQVTEPDDALSRALIVICSELMNSSKTAQERAQLKKYMLDIKAQKYKGIPVGRWRNADARHAILIRDSIHGPANVSLGFGAVRDFKTGPPFLSESNSAWFRFRFEKDTLLTFDIVPIDEKDDYDFTLFRCAGSSCADAIRRQEVKPLRLCHSGHHSYNGATGLSEYGSPDFVGPGPGSTYSQAVKVKAGEEYYLLVDVGNEYITRGQLPHGFMIYFHDYWPKKRSFALKNVYFPTGQSTLSPASHTGLNKMVAELKKNKALTIEIRGHTDSQGDETKNLELSAARAGAVRDYLISRGIEKKRVSARGYGSSKPLAPNNSEAGRKKNRRVEFALVMR